jgi:hypothetical protein
MADNQVSAMNKATIKKDRMRFTKNTLSSTLCYLAIFLNALYFVTLYSIDKIESVGQDYYGFHIGLSVVYNLLFMLFSFLCSEGVKNYSLGYSISILAIGVMQIVRIFYIPMKAHEVFIPRAEGMSRLLSDTDFTLITVFLTVSAVCCITAGVVGIIKYVTLENYKKQTGLS